MQVGRLADGRRHVLSVSELTGMEGDVVTMQDIYVFRRTGVADDGRILGEFIPTGLRPRCADELAAAGVTLGLLNRDPERV